MLSLLDGLLRLVGKMRLTCPNCGAQYEVPEDVIPAEGRDVQCSNCGTTWFQAHLENALEAEPEEGAPPPEPEWSPVVDAEPTAVESNFDGLPPSGQETLESVLKQAVRRSIPDEVERVVAEEILTQSAAADDLGPDDVQNQEDPLGFEAALDADLAREAQARENDEEDPEDEIALPVTSARRTRRKVDPDVADVLRQEAAYEADARRAEANQIETQPELGLGAPEEDEAAKRAREARARMARIRGRSSDERSFSPASPMPANSRRDLLPDIEEINSTLRSTEDRMPEEIPDGRPTLKQRRAGGNRIGFALALLLLAAALFVYMRPETVKEIAPASETAVNGYIESVDQGRIWLDTQMTQIMLWLDSLSGTPTEPPSQTDASG